MKKLTTIFTALFVAVILTACASQPKVASELVQAEEGHVIYNGKGFSFSYDPELWVGITSDIDATGDVAAELGVEVSDDQIQDMNNGSFAGVDDPLVNFNIVSVDGGHNGQKIDYDDIAEEIASQYGVITGMDYLGHEIVEVNGYKYIKFESKVSEAVFGVEMRMEQYMFYSYDKNYTITYSEVNGCKDTSKAEFRKVLNTFVYDDK